MLWIFVYCIAAYVLSFIVILQLDSWKIIDGDKLSVHVLFCPVLNTILAIVLTIKHSYKIIWIVLKEFVKALKL